MEKIRMMSDETGEELELYVLEQTRINGISYILAADSEFGDAECMILRDKAAAENSDSIYEFVEDDTELDAVLQIFEELLEDVNIER